MNSNTRNGIIVVLLILSDHIIGNINTILIPITIWKIKLLENLHFMVNIQLKQQLELIMIRLGVIQKRNLLIIFGSQI